MTFITILEAIIALPKIGKMFERYVGLAAGWWFARQTEKTKEDLHEAAKDGSLAKTKEDRINALKKWQDALNRRRVE